MKPNPAIKTARVQRRESYEQSQLRAIRAAQAAAHHVMDVIDATRGPIPADGPRTASHPMATRIDPPATRGPQEPASAIPEGAVTFEEPPQLRMASQIAIGLALTGVFLLGLALGKVL